DQHYIAVKVDQDARPDLSRRYENYGWPATIVFGPDGREIVKRRGYIPPARFAALLQAILDDPSPVRYADSEPVTAFSQSPLLAQDIRRTLSKQFVATHDFRVGGLDQQQKFMDRDSVEYALMLAMRGDEKARAMALQTLDGSLNLIDPAWGGAYQYSTHRDWQHPHFEKIMFIQAEHVRLYSLAYQALGDERFLQAARAVDRYVTRFLLSPDGAFYVSQDADLIKGQHSEDYFSLPDEQRLKLGIPAIDKHLYSRENGWMIHAQIFLYAATGDEAVLARALTAARWVLNNRALPGGGFRHDAVDPAGPYLEDTLAMGRAFLGLYQVTGEREWLQHAEAAARFIGAKFALGDAGFVTSVAGGVLDPLPQTDENIMLARFANLLSRYTGSAQYRKDAERAMRYLVTRQVALRRITEAGILIADIELSSDPAHFTVVGRKDDVQARALFLAAQRYRGGYKRIEWWDRREGAMPNPDIQYPVLEQAAAFVCTDGSCSLPQFKAKELLAIAERLETR
ncbi:MAG: hypothetical protein ACREUQ_08735, partial [Burkholderiales bacterium]